ncbi:MAG: alpha-amylase/4-alpha-glucanotransferase domain-containing protein [bacterium]
MKTINFLFAVHLHQPVGNFEGVFRYATETAYEPFLRAMKKNPQFPFAFHASGPLWEYWEKHKPELFDIIGELVERGQLELLGGGFYEPILAVIPRRDALGQLNMMADYIEDKFGRRPRGIWLTERIWEPHLPELLHTAGVEYTLTDDYHFKSIGIVGDDLFGHYITEDGGHSALIFPISQDLRYTIPFADPKDTVDFLVNHADTGHSRALVFGDDGEKFGLWPGTKKWVWDEGWMANFLRSISENRDVIKMSRFDDWIDTHPPIGKVYLPTCSYFEMSEWTLPANLAADFHRKAHTLEEEGKMDEWRPFLKGGFWRGFLTKYPESAWMHKRMMHASNRLTDSGLPFGEGTRALYRAQCNCAYWHGVFGGLYLPHLRRGIFDNILRCEKLITKNDEKFAIREDMDIDGFDEVILRDGNLQIFVKPGEGGKIAEIDLLKWERNITDTFSRRPEGYHHLVEEADEPSEGDGQASIHDIVQAKEAGLSKLLHYDWFNRRFLVDFIFGEGLTPDNFRDGSFPELGDFANQPYNIIDGPKSTPDGQSVKMRRDGGIFHGDIGTPFSIEKEIVLLDGGEGFVAKFKLINPNDEDMKVHFGTETHFSLMSGDHPRVHFHFDDDDLKNIRTGDRREFSNIRRYELHENADGWKIICTCDEGDIWMSPIETVSNSESGFERIYQQTSLLHHWKLEILAEGEVTLELKWLIEDYNETQ